MKLDTGALTAAAAIFWGGAMLVVGLANLAWPGYGRAFLELAASLYPGYRAGATIGQVAVGTLYGVVDGAVAGAVFGWLYNRLSEAFGRAA